MTAVVSVSWRRARARGFKSAGQVRLGTRDRGGRNRFRARPCFRKSPTAEFHTAKLNERNHSMNPKKHKVLVGLAVCALALGALGSAKNPVTRPLKMKAEMVIYVDLTDGSFVSPNWGECTLGGKFNNVGVGWMNPQTLEVFSSEGTAVVANGDKILWRSNGQTGMDITGGTGRFEHATGKATWVITIGDIDVDLEAMTMTVYCTYTAEGTITY